MFNKNEDNFSRVIQQHGNPVSACGPNPRGIWLVSEAPAQQRAYTT